MFQGKLRNHSETVREARMLARNLAPQVFVAPLQRRFSFEWHAVDLLNVHVARD
jgi:hypothetical protein